jgi:soluble lytic murein transglycosylase-like protein
MRVIVVALLVSMLSMPLRAEGNWRELVAALCPERGVPEAIALGVIRVESAGYPYALGVSIHGRHEGYSPSRQAVAGVVLRSALHYTDNIGIGLMQINWRVWGRVLDTEPEDLLDARTNIRLGCRLLGMELAGEGELWERLGRYHSRTPRLQAAYARKVMRAIERESRLE